MVQLAFDAHDGQKRRSGEPFIIHPVEVARILGELVRFQISEVCFNLHLFVAVLLLTDCSSRNWIGSPLLLDYCMIRLRTHKLLLSKE